MNMKLTKKYIWDYDTKNMDLSDPEILLWYLKRKIEYGDWEVLDRKTLKKYLPKIEIDFYLKYILAEIKKIAVHLRISQIREHKQFNRYEFWFKKNKSVLKVEFIFYPFKNMKKPKKIKDFNVLTDSIEDITANKTHAIYERHEPKDVFDLYRILIKKKIKFLKIFKWVEEKFGVKIDPVLFLSRLLRGADSLDKIRPLLLNKELLHTEAIKKYFQKEADKYLKTKI